jgi:hypothetical protein
MFYAADDYCPLAGFFLGLDRFNEAAASMPRMTLEAQEIVRVMKLQ